MDTKFAIEMFNEHHDRLAKIEARLLALESPLLPEGDAHALSHQEIAEQRELLIAALLGVETIDWCWCDRRFIQNYLGPAENRPHEHRCQVARIAISKTREKR